VKRAPPRVACATDALEAHHALLWRIAYRMLGSASDADDVLQEVAMRWLTSDRGAIHHPRAWLIAVSSRLCISQLRRTKRAREAYVGAWLPEPVADERETELSLGALLRLQRLKPAERIVFVLHEALGLRHGELAAVLGRTPVACRQALVRARRKLAAASRERALEAAPEERVEAFRAALASGDARAIASLLSGDALLLSDGGGRVVSALRPILGGDRIARFFAGVLRKARGIRAIEPRRINGAPGLVFATHSAPFAALAFEAAPSSAIALVLVVRNPEKLRGFAPA
jgi:RNA polymerase sigma-70 factor (ECF subfamily)